MAKRLFKLFGFHIHDAPGEAEAECALLQQQGIVDAVLSEDVDTIMFGCTKTLRNWSAEATRSAAPTHVSVYDAAELKQGETGLDREGMVLVALMSGGDYIPEGVPGCGIKLACEAAKAGFGRRLCRIKKSDSNAMTEWRKELKRELQTNESKYFRRRHRALIIPDDFPNMDVLRYYTHPVVSEAASVERLRREFPSKKEIDLVGLRAFTSETFDWTYKTGAIRFIKVLAPGVLNQALLNMSQRDIGSDDPGVREAIEGRLVKAISTRRTHFSTDGTQELRISYIPKEIVRIDLNAEEEEPISSYGRSGLALNSDDDELEVQIEDGTHNVPKKAFDPFQPDLIWVPETVAKLGVPLTVEDWEARQRSKQLAKEKKTQKRRPTKTVTDMPTGTLDKWVKSTKPVDMTLPKEVDTLATLLPSSQPAPFTAPASRQPRPHRTIPITRGTETSVNETSRERLSKSLRTNTSKTKSPASRPSLDVNPWSIASSQTTPKSSRRKALHEVAGSQPHEAILISSSPERSPSPVPVTLPTVGSSRHELGVNSSAISHLERSTRIQDLFKDPRSPHPSGKTMPDYTSGWGKHNHASEGIVQEPTAKRLPQSRNALVVRDTNAARKSTRAQRTAKVAAQVSIKNFGRNAEAINKRSAVNKPSFAEFRLGPDDDSEVFQDVRTLGSRKPSKNDAQLPAPLSPSSYIAGSGSRRKEVHAAEEHQSTTDQSDITFTRLSSPLPPAASPFTCPRSSSSTGMTRLYFSTTSDDSRGFFEEVQVTRAEADRIMSQHELEKAKRPGGRRVWRESEVTILDLTGED